MLKGIHPLLGADLLGVLAAMGHGDVLAVVDRNFPATSHGRRVVHLANTSADQAVAAVLTVFPVDDFVTPAVWRMGPVDDPERELEVHVAVRSAVDAAEGRGVAVEPLERFEFYRRTADAYAVVTTSEDRPYGCFLLTKGVVRGA